MFKKIMLLFFVSFATEGFAQQPTRQFSDGFVHKILDSGVPKAYTYKFADAKFRNRCKLNLMGSLLNFIVDEYGVSQGAEAPPGFGYNKGLEPTDDEKVWNFIGGSSGTTATFEVDVFEETLTLKSITISDSIKTTVKSPPSSGTKFYCYEMKAYVQYSYPGQIEPPEGYSSFQLLSVKKGASLAELLSDPNLILGRTESQ